MVAASMGGFFGLFCLYAGVEHLAESCFGVRGVRKLAGMLVFGLGTLVLMAGAIWVLSQ
jgi:hypothetical protein